MIARYNRHDFHVENGSSRAAAPDTRYQYYIRIIWSISRASFFSFLLSRCTSADFMCAFAFILFLPYRKDIQGKEKREGKVGRRGSKKLGLEHTTTTNQIELID